MKEKLKEAFGNIRSRVTSAFMHSASARGGRLKNCSLSARGADLLC